MPVIIHPHLDEQGWRRAGSPECFEALAGFLEQDVQSSVASCDELLSISADIEQGVVPTWQGTGNAFTLTITPQGASLQCEFDEGHHCQLSLPEFGAALQAWRHFIASNESA